VFVPFLCPKYFAKKEFRVTKTELSQKILCQFRFCDLIFIPGLACPGWDVYPEIILQENMEYSLGVNMVNRI